MSQKRQLDDWLTSYLDYTADFESPTSYHIWTGLAVLGAACGQNYMHGDVSFHLANNLYILLIAKQGRTRKTTALRQGLKLLKGVKEVKVSPDSISKEDLNKRIGESINRHGESNYVVFSHELSAIVKTSGIDTPNYLISIYDETESFISSTLSRGEETVTKPHVTFMAATTPNFIRTGFSGIDLRENGLMSRTIMIFEEQPRFNRAFGSKPDKGLAAKLTHDLKIIASEKPRVPIHFEREARDFYEQLYAAIGQENPQNPLEDAFLARKDIHILKVSALSALSRGCPRVETEDLVRALEFIQPVQDGLENIHQLLGSDKNLHVKVGIQDFIRKEGKVLQKTLMREYMNDISFSEMKEIIDQMSAAGLIYNDGKHLQWMGR